MAKQKKNRANTGRNWLAVNAWQRGGAGKHTNKKKQASKKACRGQIKI